MSRRLVARQPGGGRHRGGLPSGFKDTGLRFTYAPRVVNRGHPRVEVWAAALRDPDGHGIALTQWRAPIRLTPVTPRRPGCTLRRTCNT